MCPCWVAVMWSPTSAPRSMSGWGPQRLGMVEICWTASNGMFFVDLCRLLISFEFAGHLPMMEDED